MAEVVSHGNRDGRTSRTRRPVSGDGSGGDGGGDSDDDDDDRKEEMILVKPELARLDPNLKSAAALILLERWGSPIYGGVAAALYQLIDQLKSSGLKIHCTVLEVDGKTIKEAERLGVNLILPERNSLFEEEEPTYFSLATHATFFPHLKDIPNLGFVFGFGIVSSSVAVHIKDKVLPDAEYIHVNIWNPEELSHQTFAYGKKVFTRRRQCLDEESAQALMVLSFGPKVWDYFEDKYHDPSIKHLQLTPLPEKLYFQLPIIRKSPNIHNFQIMTPFESGTMSELSCFATVPKAITLVANSYDNVQMEPPKWKILCYNKHDDKEVIPYLEQNPKLRISIDGFDNTSFSKELDSSHLVVIPPHLINSLNIVISTIAAGKPIIVPTMSDGAFFVDKYMFDYKCYVVFDMRDGPDALMRRIAYIIQHYDTYLEIASLMKEEMKKKVMTQVKSTNAKILDVIRPYIEISTSQRSTPGHQILDLSTAAITQEMFTENVQATQDTNIVSAKSSHKGEPKTSRLGVKVSPSYGNAFYGKSMSDVYNEFHRQQRNRQTNEKVGNAVTSIHRDLELEKVEDGCLRYVVKCGSLEALEALWSEYISERLDKTIHSTIITPALLSKIQAHYLTLDIYIPVQEYLLCKREIPLIAGKVIIPSRRHSVAAVTDLLTLKSRDSIRNKTVESLGLILSTIQIQDSKANSDLLDRADFRIEELRHFSKTFATKYHNLRQDVRVEERHCQLKRTRDNLLTDYQTECKKDSIIHKYAEQEIHSWKQHKTVIHTAGQRLTTQRDFAIIQATSLEEKCEATKAVYDEAQSDLERVNKGYPVKGSVLEVFGYGSKPGQFEEAEGIYIKNNGQCVVCDKDNHRVQVIDPIKLCCDLILQFLALPESFNPWNVTVDEDNDKYFMSDLNNGQVVVSSGQSKILNCFGSKEGIKPTGICLNDDGFLFIGDLNGYVRKYNKSGEHIARTEEGQVSRPWDLIVNKKCIFVSDFGRECVHVLNHQMQSIRDIGKGHLEGPMGLCFDHQQDGIYVCDISGHRVLHFNCDGEFLSCKGQGQLEESPLHCTV
ncbi:uncharacterized protein [Ptychodera flava]|uniref:uncharacterized protein isoform X2 n=1 Tax=Ptychodera flava TaxID=63121 RepID=UPI003969D8DE